MAEIHEVLLRRQFRRRLAGTHVRSFLLSC